MKQSKIVYLLSFLLLFITTSALAHDSSKHKKKADTTAHAHVQADSASAIISANTPPLNEFPTLHPLVVHIPIMLLMLAAVVQLVSLFLFKRELSWTAWAMLLIGFVGAYASSNWFHAHASNLPPATQALLEEHELYADYTIWLSGAALVVHSINLFFLKRKLWLSIIAAGLITASAVVVAIAGHHGAELVHKHGVGAKGIMLEQHHH